MCYGTIVTYHICNPLTLSYAYNTWSYAWVTRLVVFTIATFNIYKLCDICDSKGGTFKYRLTMFEAALATLITLLHLGPGLWGFEQEEGCGCGLALVVILVVAPFLVASFSVYFAVLSFFFGVYLASAYFGYFDMVIGIHLPHVDIL